MLQFILLVTAAYSITFGYIESPALEKMRELVGKLTRFNSKLGQLTWCYHCVGFWVSLALALVIYDNESWYMYPVLALASSGIIIMIQYKMAGMLLSNKKLNMEVEDVND